MALGTIPVFIAVDRAKKDRRTALKFELLATYCWRDKVFQISV